MFPLLVVPVLFLAPPEIESLVLELGKVVFFVVDVEVRGRVTQALVNGLEGKLGVVYQSGISNLRLTKTRT